MVTLVSCQFTRYSVLSQSRDPFAILSSTCNKLLQQNTIRRPHRVPPACLIRAASGGSAMVIVRGDVDLLLSTILLPPFNEFHLVTLSAHLYLTPQAQPGQGTEH